MRVCIYCGKRNSDGNQYCAKCGSDLSESIMYCLHCDEFFENGEKFCTLCGRKLINWRKYKFDRDVLHLTDEECWEKEYRENSHDPIKVQIEREYEEFKERFGTKICPHCGKKIIRRADVCFYCYKDVW